MKDQFCIQIQLLDNPTNSIAFDSKPKNDRLWPRLDTFLSLSIQTILHGVYRCVIDCLQSKSSNIIQNLSTKDCCATGTAVCWGAIAAHAELWQ